MSVRDLLIVGAGPTGLSAAIAAGQRGLDYHVIEQGTLVNSIHRFPPQMVFFTTPELLEIGGLPFVSPYEKPTRVEALRYYRRVADTHDLRISFGEQVLSVQREDEGAAEAGGERPRPSRAEDMEIRGEGSASVRAGGAAPAPVETGWAGGDSLFSVETRSTRGVRRVRHARFVIMAIGYYDHPNRLNVDGEDLPHVHHYYREPYAHYRERVVVVGGGNSAAEAALELFRAGASVTLLHRGPELKSTIKYWVRPDIENRIKEGSIAARFNTVVTAIRPTAVVTSIYNSQFTIDRGEEIPADAVYLLTGYRADSDLLVRAGVHLNDREAPVHDPETFETNVPGLFVAGGAVAGVDTGTIFIENGRFHGERIVDTIAARLTR